MHKEKYWYKQKLKEAAFIEQNVFGHPSADILRVWTHTSVDGPATSGQGKTPPNSTWTGTFHNVRALH